MSGRMRTEVQGGGGQPDLRLSPNKISHEQLQQFISGTPNAELRQQTPLQIFINQRPLSGGTFNITTDQLELKQYGPSRNEISIKRQQPGYTNQRWAAAGQQMQASGYIYILRLSDNSFTSGWATENKVGQFPSNLRGLMQQFDQKVHFFGRPSGEVAQILAALREYHNVLLYGPPGTGKTYLMQEIKRWFLNPKPGLIYDEVNSTFIEGSADTTESSYIVAPDRSKRDWRWVTFHQSYSYEEFIGGRRPEPKDQTLLYLKPVDGVLLDLANAALADHACLLLIDEINRGNVSRIFGEFITLMEPDKRLREDGSSDPIRTVEVRLPHKDENFKMPYHLYTLASMNSVDRSVMPLDAALRRRFHIIEMEPNYAELGRWFGLQDANPSDSTPISMPPNSIQAYGKIAVSLLYRINLFIQTLAGPDFEAGHGFFWSMNPAIESRDLRRVRAALVEVWNNRLLPHLYELFRSQPDYLGAILRSDENNTTMSKPYPYRRVALPDYVRRIGGVAGVEPQSLQPDEHAEKVLQFIARMDVKQETTSNGEYSE